MKVEEILQEIESMAMLDHPNVIKASLGSLMGSLVNVGQYYFISILWLIKANTIYPSTQISEKCMGGAG